MTWTDAISSPSSHRLVSTSWIIESVIVMKLVNESGTVGLRWTLWRISALADRPAVERGLDLPVARVLAAHVTRR